jgi:hypothetical protein
MEIGMIERLKNWLIENSLWIVGFGLMLASSGIDGAYMTRWMPPAAFWLGYILNTTSDIGSEVLMYWFGRIYQAGGKRSRLAFVLLPAELITIVYSWFFSWRQLRLVMPPIESDDWRWVAPISAGFIPLLLAAIGFAQSLLAGRAKSVSVRRSAAHHDVRIAPQATETVAQPSGNGRKDAYRYCAACDFLAETPQAWAGHCRGAAHRAATARNNGDSPAENTENEAALHNTADVA